MLETLKKYKLKEYNFFLVICVIALSIFGVMIVYSAGGEFYRTRQLEGLGLGLLVMIAVSLMDYRKITNLYQFYYVLNIVLMFAVKFFGDDAGGAQRWLIIGGIRFQPSELSKILIILAFAKYLQLHQEDFMEWKRLLLTIVLMIIPILLIEEQPDLSTSIVVFVICCMILFITGLSWKIVGAAFGIAIPCIGVFFYLITREGQKILEGYQVNRILAWLHPEDYPDLSYQQQNAIMAIGSGGLWGKGLNNNAVDSVKNGNYISAPQTDFIFAVTGEELGFMGCLLIIILLLIITLICIWIGSQARDLQGKIIACGIGTWIGVQGFINICVVTGLMPNTGLTLPFISYGLTSLVSLFIAIGLVLNVGLQKSIR